MFEVIAGIFITCLLGMLLFLFGYLIYLAIKGP